MAAGIAITIALVMIVTLLAAGTREAQGAGLESVYGVGTDLSTTSQRQLAALRAQEIGFVFQGFNLIPTLTAAENVDTGVESLGLDQPNAQSPSAKRSPRLGSGIDRTISRANSLVASSSASQSLRR